MSPPDDDDPFEEPVDPDRLMGCAYWRCGDIFERRTANQQFCRKACRSRQRKWERAQERKRIREARKLRLFALGLALALLSGCSGNSDGSTPPDASTEPTVSPAAPVPAEATSGVVASSQVPTIEEFEAQGIGRADAQCFIDEVDPDGNGIIDDDELILIAFATCIG